MDNDTKMTLMILGGCMAGIAAGIVLGKSPTHVALITFFVSCAINFFGVLVVLS